MAVSMKQTEFPYLTNLNEDPLLNFRIKHEIN